LALQNLLAAAACAGAGWLCLRLQAPGMLLPGLWLPAGLALSVLAIAGRRLLPGVWLGQAAAILPIAGMSWGAAAAVGLSETAAVWLGVALLHRLVPRGMTRDSSPARFLLVAYGCMALAGLCAPIVLRAFGMLPGGSIDAAIIAWWLADALGIVVLVPAVLEVRDALSHRRRVPLCTPTLAALALATGAFGLLTFAAGWLPLANGALQAALLLPPTLIVTVRCHPAVPYTLGAALALALAQGAAGPFGTLLGTGAAERAFAVHGFILVAAACILFLAAHARSMRSFSASAQAGEERFRSLSALTSDWYWEQDADCRFTRLEGAAVGDAAELQWQFVGKRPEELPGFEPYNETWQAHDDDLAARKVFRGRVLRYARPDGRVSYYSVSGEPVFDSGGEFCGYRGVGRDITPEVESREALLASEKQFHEIADATFEGLLVQDFGRILFANRACAEMAA
jgi:PAS domain-containing protein